MNANTITLTDGTREIILRADAAYGWVFYGLEGWYGQTGNKLGTPERPQAHGAFPTDRALRSGRGVSFGAAFRNGTPEETEAAAEELASLGAEGPVWMIVQDPLRATRRRVTVEAVDDRDPTRRYTGDATVSLFAADSRRYDVEGLPASTGPAQAGQGRVWPAVWPVVWPEAGSTGRITLTNTGKAPSAPTFILSGGFDSALITCLETGARIGFNRPVPVGSRVVIDTATRQASIDGVSDVSRWLQFREWEVVPGGASRTFQFDATGIVRGPWEVAATNLAFGIPSAILASRVNDVVFGGDRWYQFSASGTPGGMRQQVTGLVAGQTYTFSAEVANPGTAAINLTLISFADTGGNTVLLQPGERRIVSATGSRSSYDGGYNFADVRGPSGTVFLLRRNTVQIGPVDNQTPFDGETSGSDIERFRWTAGADSSPSVRETRPPIQASLEGTVRSAWW